MNENRKYAEELLGIREKGHFDTQRKVAGETYQTNWDALTSRYNNLRNNLEKIRNESKTKFANDLVNVTEDSFDRNNAINTNLVDRGLVNSGLVDKAEQMDTRAKGQDVLSLLQNLGSVLTGSMEKQAQIDTSQASGARDVMKGYSDTLGEINAKDLAGDMQWKQTLAQLSESKAQRDDARARSGSATSEEDKKLEDQYTRRALNDTLTDPDLSDEDKTLILKIMFDKPNAGDIVSAYNQNLKAESIYKKDKKNLTKELTKKEMAVKRDELARNRLKYNTTSSYSSLFEQPKSLEEGALDNILGNINTKNLQNTNSIAPLERDIAQRNLDSLIKKGITYEDLAKMLYGN